MKHLSPIEQVRREDDLEHLTSLKEGWKVLYLFLGFKRE